MVKVRLESVEGFERDVKLRLPFRFGVITVTEVTQAVIRATVALEDGRQSMGIAAESLAAKWFDKNPAFSDQQNLAQLRQSLALAIHHYRGQGWSTPFGLYSGCYTEQLARGAELGLVPLAACYGPALLDRAILDALGRLSGLSFAAMLRRNLPGIAATELTPELAGFDLAAFLAGLEPRPSIAIRHTVGLLDPIVAGDQTASERVGDGLPETLQDVARRYRGAYYKLKVEGDLAADLERLRRIAEVLDREIGRYQATLDGNEQYDDIDGIAELWRRMCATPALERLVASTLFIEQPIKRAAALARPVVALAHHKALIIDESDGELSSFPTARRLGYSGVSSKSCKGLYKSVLNAARIAKWNAEAGAARYFMTAEDLTTLAGVSVQQDLALVSLLGLEHVERNGHHFVDGMSFAPPREQDDFARAHPDLYEQRDGVTRLAIEAGRLRLASLDCAGFAVAAPMDFSCLRAMPAETLSPLVPAHPERA